MPVFVVTAPDGRKLRITAPEGATEQDAIAYAQRQLGGAAEAAPAPAGPLKVGQAVSGGADASARAAPITQEFNPRTSGADATTQMLTQLLRNPATAPPLLGTAAGLRLAGRKDGAVQDAARRTGADVLSLLSNADSDQELAARMAVPGVKFEDDPRVGRVAVLPDGSRQALNMPGITGRSVESFGAQALPFLAGPGGVGTGVLSRLGLGALRGAAGGPLREAVEARRRTAAGGENSLGGAAKDIVIDTATGGVGEAFLPLVLQPVAKKIRDLLGKNQWSRASVADALKGEGLPESTVDAVFKAGQQGQDPVAVLRLVEAKDTNVPLTAGQVQGDDDLMAQLRTLLTRNAPGDTAGQTASQALRSQDEAIGQLAGQVRTAAGVDPTMTGAAGGEAVLGRLGQKRQAAEARVDGLYKLIPEDATINPRMFNAREYSVDGKNIQDSMAEFWAANKDYSPRVAKMVRAFAERTRQPQPVGLREFDAVRRQFSGIAGTATDGPDRAAAAKALSLFNNMEDFASQTGNVYSASGDKAAVALRDARRARRTLGEQFEGVYEFKGGGEADDVISRLTSGRFEPQQAMDKLLGAGGTVNVKRNNFSKDMERLSQFDPESYSIVQREAVDRSVRQLVDAKTPDAVDKVLARLRADKKALAPVIPEAQFQELMRLGRMQRSALFGRVGSKAELPNKRALQQFITAGVMAAGSGAALSPVLGPAGAMGAALGIGTAAARALQKRGENKMVNALTQPFTTLPTPAVQGVDARLFPPTFLQYLNQDE